ncbi:MAG: hypothetical protein ACE5F9_10225 [Phycisphaerae bacterium]
MPSPTQQLITVLINSFGAIITAAFTSIFSAMLTPLIQAMLGAFGIGA